MKQLRRATRADRRRGGGVGGNRMMRESALTWICGIKSAFGSF
ncbi:hypothetical protein [Thiospirillum jenense]|nr:hypothetical protein [Thiospirillum jenense]